MDNINYDTVDNFDLPSWDEIKLYSEAAAQNFLGNPAAALAPIAAAQQIKAIKASGGTVTPEQIAIIKSNAATSADKAVTKSLDDHIVNPVINFIGSFKWIIIAIVVVVLAGLFFRAKG